MAETAVSAVLRNVGSLAVQETTFLCGVTVEVDFLKEELMRLQGYLTDAESKRRSGSESAAILMSQIRDAAYDAENVIEAAEYIKKRNRLRKGFMGAISSFRRLCIKEPQHSRKDTQMMRGIIALSYKDLPNHYLKSCLLYLAAFLEDFNISVRALIRLWIAERFIPHTSKHTVEETANNYVIELAQRSLVQVVETSSIHGWIEKIMIHDIIRDWCIEEAALDSFLDVIDETTTGQVGASSSHSLISYRCSFQDSSEQILQASPNLRALFGFGLSSVTFFQLRFLRVLHVENSSLENLSEVIGGCIHLRHLRLRRCEEAMVPSSIRKLLYLQTIDVPDLDVSISLWDIPTLRYVDVFHISLPRSVQLPQTLRELHMWATADENEKDPMPILEMLPCLVLLELRRFIPVRMSFGAQGFPRLQELRLEGCSIYKWMIEVGAMPKLSCLSFIYCTLREEIPDGLLHLPSLRFVSLDHVKDYSNDSTLDGLRRKGCKIRGPRHYERLHNEEEE